MGPVVERALGLLWQAKTYADDVEQDTWEFAIDLQSLLTNGVGLNELRWLTSKGYVAHAVELTEPSAPFRSFQAGKNLRYDQHSCFVLTEKGALFAAPQQLAEATGTRLGFASPPSNHDRKPIWDRHRHELRCGGLIVKQFKVPAPNQERILATFEEDGWPSHIDDPLPPRPDQDAKRRLHETITSLNRHQRERVLRFKGDGRGQGVLWEFVTSNLCVHKVGMSPV